MAERECTIKRLEDGDNVLTETAQLKEHTTDFYKNLFGSEEPSRIHLQDNFWSGMGLVDEVDKELLIKDFTLLELERAVKDMKPDSAPGPDGLSTLFF